MLYLCVVDGKDTIFSKDFTSLRMKLRINARLCIVLLHLSLRETLALPALQFTGAYFTHVFNILHRSLRFEFHLRLDSGLKGGAHSNHYRMQECTSSRPLPTTHHKPLTANDIHTYCISIRLHANAQIN